MRDPGDASRDDDGKKDAGTGEPGARGPADREPGARGPADREPEDGVLRIYPPRGGAHEQRLYDTAVAYARGDFGSARRLCTEVVDAPHSEDEAGFAREILRRTAVDPVALVVAVGCFGLFWLIVYLTLWQ